MSIAETSDREPPSKRKERLDGQDGKPKPHEMGLQVPRSVHTQGTQKGVVPAAERAPGRGVPRVGAPQRESDRRRASDGRPRTHDDRDTAKVRGVKRGGVHQREKCDSPGKGVRRAKAKLHRSELLGERVFCLDGWKG